MQRLFLAASLLAIVLLLVGRAWRIVWLGGPTGPTPRLSTLPQSSPLASPLVQLPGQTPAEGLIDPATLSSPLATPGATRQPPQLVHSAQLPAVTHDLLFLADYSLKRWDHASGQIQILFGPERANDSSGQQAVNFQFGPGPPTGAV